MVLPIGAEDPELAIPAFTGSDAMCAVSQHRPHIFGMEET
jgi:hypothetical protein